MKIVLFLFALARLAYAGAGTIVVIDGPGGSCVKSEPEMMVFRLTSAEAVGSLRNWLHHRPQDLVMTDVHIGRKDYDKSFNWSAYLDIAFTGYIKFCGETERKQYFAAMLDEMKRVQSDERLYVLVLLHSRSKMLLELVESELTSHPEKDTYRSNLEKAKRLIEYQRKTPEPYPTEKTVRRIEKRIKAG